MPRREPPAFPETAKKLGSIEESLIDLHSEYRKIVNDLERGMAETEEALRSNDEDEFVRVQDLEENFKEASGELEMRVATALVEAFSRLAEGNWVKEDAPAKSPAEVKAAVYRLPINRMYELRLYRSFSYPKTEKGKTFNPERWNLNIESRNPQPANEVSGERFPSEYMVSFETRSGSEIFDLKPAELPADFVNLLLPRAVKEFKDKQRL